MLEVIITNIANLSRMANLPKEIKEVFSWPRPLDSAPRPWPGAGRSEFRMKIEGLRVRLRVRSCNDAKSDSAAVVGGMPSMTRNHQGQP